MDNTFSSSDRAILANVTAFIRRGTESQKQQLDQYLREHPIRVTLDLIFSENELPLRLGFIENIRRRLQENSGTSQKPFYFSNIQIAALSLMSVETLRDLGRDASSIMNATTLQYLLPFLINGFFPGFSSPVRKAKAFFRKSICSNDDERRKCLLRHRRVCVLTTERGAVPCHIAPFGLTTNQLSIDAFTDSRYLSKLMGDVWVQISRIMAIDSIGAFEKSWNMLCLQPLLCEYWSKCLFGLKYLGMTANYDGSTNVEIQFHWMPRNKVEFLQKVEPPYDKAIDTMLQITDIDKQPEEFFSDNLKSGTSFSVRLNNEEEAIKMKAALELQWVAVRLAAMCGIFKSWELGQDLFKDEYDDDDEDEDEYKDDDEDLDMSE